MLEEVSPAPSVDGDCVLNSIRSTSKDNSDNSSTAGANDISAEGDLHITTQDAVYPLFQSLWPRLDILNIIYRGVHNTLFPTRKLDD